MEQQQQYENQKPHTSGDSEKDHARDDVAEQLIDQTKLVTFSRHATLGREFAKRGHEANLKAGQHYLRCQQMLKYKSKGPWFAAEAKAIGVDARTIYNYIDEAKAEIERERWKEILKNFQNLPPAEQESTIANAWDEANKFNQEKDKKNAAAKAQAEEEAKLQKDLDDFVTDTATEPKQQAESEQSAPVPPEQTTHFVAGGPYTLRFDFMTDAMRNGLDVLTRTQNWLGAQKDLIAVIARILSQHGLGTVEELLKPNGSAV